MGVVLQFKPRKNELKKFQRDLIEDTMLRFIEDSARLNHKMLVSLERNDRDAIKSTLLQTRARMLDYRLALFQHFKEI